MKVTSSSTHNEYTEPNVGKGEDTNHTRTDNKIKLCLMMVEKKTCYDCSDIVHLPLHPSREQEVIQNLTPMRK